MALVNDCAKYNEKLTDWVFLPIKQTNNKMLNNCISGYIIIVCIFLHERTAEVFGDKKAEILRW
jgi:hypothetical protein